MPSSEKASKTGWDARGRVVGVRREFLQEGDEQVPTAWVHLVTAVLLSSIDLSLTRTEAGQIIRAHRPPSSPWSVPVTTPKPTPGPRPKTDAGLPDFLVAALDQVEADLPDGPDAVYPAQQSLAEDVAQSLRRRVRDPLTQAVLSRAKIFAWCLHQAVQNTEPESRRDRPLYRRADPLSEPPDPAQSEPAGAPSGATRKSRRTQTRGGAKEKP